MKKNIVIIHYNTPHLTECLVRSINLFVKDAIIYIFDNSDKEPFTAEFGNVTVMDNTNGQIINFDEWLSTIKTKVPSTNKWASASHCYSVEKCIELIDENFILLDSDVLLKKDISDLYNENYIYIGDTEVWKGTKRVLPYCLFINVKKCKESNIHFFNDKFIVGLTPNCTYDTGAYFYIACKEMPSKKINYNNYIVHLDNGSLLYGKNASAQRRFLQENKKLYTGTCNNMIETNYKEQLKKFCANKHLNINIDSPKTIQDKINWLKVNDSTPLKTDCADKIKLHDYCKKTIGKDLCAPIIKIFNNTNEINWDELPNKFVIKCNHGSGMNIVVDKSSFNKAQVINKLNKWINTDFAFQNGFELHYHNIERKIFVETFLEDHTQQKSLFDYKFWCFNGVPQFFTINDGHGHGPWMNFYDMNCNPINCKRKDFMGIPNVEVKMPSKINEMIEYSKKLSEPFKLVRVDFYEVNGEVFLGELTFTPGSGFFWYTDKSYDLKIGDLLKLDVPKNKKVIYTCITGGYDNLIEPTHITEGFDYICFTDNLNLTSKVWNIRPMPTEVEGLSNVKKQRYVKINAHKMLPEYEISIYVDGSITIKGDLNEFVNNSLKENISIYIPQHPQRNCIYEEAKAVIKMKKDSKENVEPQIDRYKKEGFPSSYGLPQANIMLRKHNEEDCKRLMEAWFNELKNNSHRDQLSFNYVLWKNNDIKIKYLDKHIYKSKWFSWGSHCKSGNAARTIRNVVKSSPSEMVLVGDIKSKDTYTRSIAVRSELLTKNRKLPTYSLKIYS